MRKPSPALVISVIALFVALGGAGMAATGGNFILGKANSATSTTSLSAPIGGKALQLSNTSTIAGATALGLTAAPGHAPFAVNTSTKVANLNADRLDGIDSSSLVQGGGNLKPIPLVDLPNAGAGTLMNITGVGKLEVTGCASGNQSFKYTNESGATQNYVLNSAYNGRFDIQPEAGTLAASGGSFSSASNAGTDLVQLSVSYGTHVVEFDVATKRDATNPFPDCLYWGKAYST